MGPEADVHARDEGVLAGEAQRVLAEPAAGGAVEGKDDGADRAAEGGAVDDREAPVAVPQERQHRERRQQRRLLGEERGGEHEAGEHGDTPRPRLAHDDEADEQQRDEQRVDAGEVEPRAAQAERRGEDADRAHRGPAVARLDPDQPAKSSERHERRGDRHEPQRREVHPEHPRRRGGHVVVERRVEERCEADRGRAVERLTVEDPLDVQEHAALEPLERVRVVEAGERDREVAGDERQRGDEHPAAQQPVGAAGPGRPGVGPRHRLRGREGEGAQPVGRRRRCRDRVAGGHGTAASVMNVIRLMASSATRRG